MNKLLADESLDFRIVKALRAAGYEVAAIAESDPSVSDDDVLGIANKPNAILLTYNPKQKPIFRAENRQHQWK